MRLRQLHFDRFDRAAVLCVAAPACRAFRRRVRRADGSQGVAFAQAKTGRCVQDQNPRAVVQDHGGHRRLLRAGSDHERSARASSHGGAKDFRQPPRRHPARAGATFFAHALGDPRGRNGGYRKPDERVEGREVTSLSSLRKQGPITTDVSSGKDCGPSIAQHEHSWLWVPARASLGRDDVTTPHLSMSARRGGSGLPRSIRTAP